MYIPLTDIVFLVRTVSYEPSFFPVDLDQQKKRGSVTYSTDRENEVSKIFIISLRLTGHAQKETFKFSRLYSEIRPTKWTNHTVHTNERYNKCRLNLNQLCEILIKSRTLFILRIAICHQLSIKKKQGGRISYHAY